MSDDKDAEVDTSQKIAAKVAGMLATLLAAWVAQKVLASVWQRATGHEPPKPEHPGEARLGEVVLAAGFTGAVVALSRVLAQRGTARYFS